MMAEVSGLPITYHTCSNCFDGPDLLSHREWICCPLIRSACGTPLAFLPRIGSACGGHRSNAPK